jgi:hypothetical protein
MIRLYFLSFLVFSRVFQRYNVCKNTLFSQTREGEKIYSG